jgi:bifunctional UDP-N-acetylglucosamine pyrophosphorylase/glucosamine-1-phosphate N-acetyltransferase
MLFHTIDAIKDFCDDITVILYHQASLIKESINSHYTNINFHIQDVEKFPGTGGALKGVVAKYDRVLILNGDMPLITTSSLRGLIDGEGDINMSVIRLLDSTGYGRVMINNSKVEEIVEEKDCTPIQKEVKTVNAGIYAIKRELLERYIPALDNNNAQKEYYLTDIVKMAVDEGREVTPIYVKEEEFKGVNSKLDLAYAQDIMQSKIRERWMMAGVSMTLPNTIYIDSEAIFEGECIVESGVSIIGKSKIISSHIKTNSVVEDAIIEDSSIGPMARVRPQTILKDTHIGNFVEVKKSTLKGVKAGHLSYIGDTSIDEGTNIGAGVITCNYDGKAKYKTTIGKNVFIGSDTQLVAPVTIEDDVLIGAGSTINKDISKGELAISRVPLKRVSGFFYKFFGRE